MPPALHGLDIAYTFYNDGPGSTVFGTPVDATVSVALQEYITNFVMTGSPNNNTYSPPVFPMNGENFQVQFLNITGLGMQIKDPTANERCDWWQKALYH